MAQVKRMEEEKKARKGGERRFGTNRVSREAANWASLDKDRILRAICAVTRAGGALRFGYTADGGAYALGIYGDGPTPYTEFWRPNEDVNKELDDLAQLFYDIAEDAGIANE